MGVSPRRVHDKTARILPYRFGKGCRALLNDDVPPALGAGNASVDLCAVLEGDLGHDDTALELGLADLALDLGSIDSEIAEIRQQLLSAILAANQRKELRTIAPKSANMKKSHVSETYVSSMKVVQQVPSIKVGWVRREVRKGMLVLIPRILNSTKARSIFRRAIS